VSPSLGPAAPLPYQGGPQGWQRATAGSPSAHQPGATADGSSGTRLQGSHLLVRDSTSGDGPLSPLRPFRPAVATRLQCVRAVRKRHGGGHVLRPHAKHPWDRSRWSVGSKRRPGGHRARRGRRPDHLRRHRERCTLRATPVHHWMRTSPSPVARFFARGRRGPPEGRSHSWMQLCGYVLYRSGGADLLSHPCAHGGLDARLGAGS